MKAGIIQRTAWGRIIFVQTIHDGRESDRQASICPRGTASIPALRISAMKAPQTHDKASIPDAIADNLIWKIGGRQK